MARRGWVAGLAAAALSVALVAVPGTAAGPAAAITVSGLPARTQTVQCPSWSGLHGVNPYASVMAGYVRIPGFSTARVGTSSGSISWGANPYRNVSWRVWFASLKWIGGLVWTGLGRGITVNGVTRPPTDAERVAALNRATLIVRSYLAANPRLTSAPTAEQIASMGNRTQALACLAEAIGRPSWLVNAAHAHTNYIASHYKGAWNQGQEQDLGALAVGCIIGPSSIAATAASRMAYALRVSVQADGSTNEQAPGYAGYSYVLWNTALDRLQRCGLTPPPGFERLPKLAEFVAQATQPDGRLVQLGDTTSAVPLSWAGTPTEYAASGGAVGTPPASTVGVYRNGGYVFGRTTWAPMRSAAYYTLRFGPGTRMHGHFDHTAVTWYARGHHVLMDSGFVGYNLKTLRAALWMPAAHNELVLTGVNPAHTATALTRSVQTDLYDAYTMADKPNVGVSRTRSVLVAHGQTPDVMVVTDWSAATKASLVPRITTGVYRQHWHLPPGYGVTISGADRITATKGSEKVTLVRVPVVGTPSSRSATVTRFVQASAIGKYAGNYDAQFLSTGWSTRMVTVVVPSATSDAVSVRRTVNADRSYTLTITVGARTLYVSLDAAGNPLSAALPAPPAAPVG